MFYIEMEGPLSCVVTGHHSSTAVYLCLAKTALRLLHASLLLERFRPKSVEGTVAPPFEADPMMFFSIRQIRRFGGTLGSE